MNLLSGNKKALGKIFLCMYGSTAVLLFLLALAVLKLQLEDGAVRAGISAVYVISCFLGGFLAGKVQRTRKFLWGLMLGTAYVLVMFGVTVIVGRRLPDSVSETAVNLVLCLGGGMIGGMIS